MTREFEVSSEYKSAQKQRALIIAAMHDIICRPSEGWWWLEVDQLALDKLVERLWQISAEHGLTPHVCLDRACGCHLVIAEGEPFAVPALGDPWV
jgi:hypothetical protein